MRILVMAFFCAAAMLFSAPTASAQPQMTQVSEAEEAPVDLEAERLFCPRRMGGPSARRRMAACATPITDTSRDTGAVMCAARYEHRGHRRVHLRLNQCRPLFSRRTSAI